VATNLLTRRNRQHHGIEAAIDVDPKVWPSPAFKSGNLMQTSRPSQAIRLTFSIALLTTLAACGGGAGDGAGTGPIAQVDGENPVPAVVGTWQLDGNWQGVEADQALLVIRDVNDDGEAETVIHDFDETDNCYFPPGIRGTTKPDDLRGEQIFLDNLPPFYEAILTLENNVLIINYFDRDDTDGDGDTAERRVYMAPNVALTEADIEPGC